MEPPIDAVRLDHVGIQVGELASAIETFCTTFGYRQATEPVVNTRHGVRVVFLEKPGSLPLKLICPLDAPSSRGARIHHLAFRADDLDATIAALSERGARVLSPPAPGEAFDDEPIAFLYAAGLNVELIATDKRRSRIQPSSAPPAPDGADKTERRT